MQKANRLHTNQGFGLIEIMAALVIMTFGLLAAGQLMVVSAGGGCLARSKDAAGALAQDKLEFLSDLYRRNPNSADLTSGSHGPQQARILNPIDGTTLNLYNIDWTVTDLADPRPGKSLEAKQISVKILPVNSSGDPNVRAPLNKTLTITAIFSPQMP